MIATANRIGEVLGLLRGERYVTLRDVSNAVLARLPELSCMRGLDLSHTALDDRRMAYLAPLENLEWLSLHDTRVTSAGLTHVAGLKRLTYLDLDATDVDDTGIALLSHLSRLEYLYAGETRLGDGALAHVAKL